jgi:large subunit ribosomal protein L23Ae
MPVTKATKSAAALKKGSGRKATKVHHNTHFFKPRTLQLPKNPLVKRSAAPKSQTAKSKAYDVIKYPLSSESAINKIESDNTLVFIVALTATKPEIKRACKEMYDVQAIRVNTLIRPDGLKKAYVKLSADTTAVDVASKLGVI